MSQQQTLIPASEAGSMVGYKHPRSWLRKARLDPSVPQPVERSGHKFWVKEEMQAYIERLIQERDAKLAARADGAEA